MNSTSAIKKPMQKRLDTLQPLRALAFLAIFTSHSELSSLGAWGVSVFLVLSGFLMFYNYHDRTLGTSLKDSLFFSFNKIKKLYPLHIFTMIAGAYFVIQTIISDYSFGKLRMFLGQLVLNVPLLQTWIPSSQAFFSMNSVAWYLSVCLFLYAAFPVVLAALKKVKSAWVAFVIMAAVYAVQIVASYAARNVVLGESSALNFQKWLTYICPLFRLGDFIIGCCLGHIFLRVRKNLNKFIATELEIAIFAVIVLCHQFYVHKTGFLGSEIFRYNMLYTPTTVCLIYLFAMGRGYLSKLLSIKPIMYIANISAYGFLLHQVIIKFVGEFAEVFLKRDLPPVLTFAAAFLVTVAFSEVYISWCKTRKKIDR